jgi:hypothetical protein
MKRPSVVVQRACNNVSYMYICLILYVGIRIKYNLLSTAAAVVQTFRLKRKKQKLHAEHLVYITYLL